MKTSKILYIAGIALAGTGLLVGSLLALWSYNVDPIDRFIGTTFILGMIVFAMVIPIRRIIKSKQDPDTNN